MPLPNRGRGWPQGQHATAANQIGHQVHTWKMRDQSAANEPVKSSTYSHAKAKVAAAATDMDFRRIIVTSYAVGPRSGTRVKIERSLHARRIPGFKHLYFACIPEF